MLETTRLLGLFFVEKQKKFCRFVFQCCYWWQCWNTQNYQWNSQAGMSILYFAVLCSQHFLHQTKCKSVILHFTTNATITYCQCGNGWSKYRYRSFCGSIDNNSTYSSQVAFIHRVVCSHKSNDQNWKLLMETFLITKLINWDCAFLCTTFTIICVFLNIYRCLRYLNECVHSVNTVQVHIEIFTGVFHIIVIEYIYINTQTLPLDWQWVECDGCI